MNAGPQTILVVEDEAAIAETIVYALRTEGFAPEWVTTGREALTALALRPVSLVVLDIGLPDLSGFDVCREVRKHSGVPIVFLTSRSTEIDRVVGLELGADDYVPKPFSPRELTARIRAILRRSVGHPTVPPTGSGAAVWSHDASRCRIDYRGHALDLTRNEYRLLAALLAAPGRVFNRDQIMAAAWTDPTAAMDRTVDAHVKSLRAKLREVAPDDDPIVTHRGLGYSLREQPLVCGFGCCF